MRPISRSGHDLRRLFLYSQLGQNAIIAPELAVIAELSGSPGLSGRHCEEQRNELALARTARQ